MGTSRCWQDNVVVGFHQRKTRTSVADRKKARRLEIRKIVKELKAAGKPVDLQAINHKVVNMFRRKRQGRKPKHKV
jgi:predicted XRE-type DNA-binding protein